MSFGEIKWKVSGKIGKFTIKCRGNRTKTCDNKVMKE